MLCHAMSIFVVVVVIAVFIAVSASVSIRLGKQLFVYSASNSMLTSCIMHIHSIC